MSHTYRLYNRPEYFNYVIDACKKAKKGDTIILATMEYRPEQATIMEIVDALCQASNQGATVTVLLDAYSLVVKHGSVVMGPLFFGKKDPRKGYGHFKKVVSSIDKMRDAGVDCHIINRPTRRLKNPFSGRSHIKFAVLNNEAFVGGCNLSHPDQLDVMVHTTSAKLTRELKKFTKLVITTEHVGKAMKYKDYSVAIDQHTELIIDSGRVKQSLIYKKAFGVIRSAKKHIYMTCQYFPNHDTPYELNKAANQGVSVHLAYNSPKKHLPTVRSAQVSTLAYKKLSFHPSIFSNQLHHGKNYLHAKILVNEKEAIIGSHNYVAIGVSLGTAEIALKSTSPAFIKMAREWVEAL
jgi:cardiolipin synthase A/B